MGKKAKARIPVPPNGECGKCDVDRRLWIVRKHGYRKYLACKVCGRFIGFIMKEKKDDT
jgi:hypothetical protein